MESFNEIQKFRVRWALLAIIALCTLFLYAIVQQIIFGKPFGLKPASNTTLILLTLIPLVLLVFVLSIKLKTTYSRAGIQYQFYPFQFKPTIIEWHQLSNAYLREYNSFYEYGGYGIRYGSSKTGKAINTSQSSKIGLQVEFKNGRLLLIGTKNPEKIHGILKTYFIKNI
jgi:hypothetical protein